MEEGKMQEIEWKRFGWETMKKGKKLNRGIEEIWVGKEKRGKKRGEKFVKDNRHEEYYKKEENKKANILKSIQGHENEEKTKKGKLEVEREE